MNTNHRRGGNWSGQYQETPEEFDRVRHRHRSYQRGEKRENERRPFEGSESETRDRRGFGSHRGDWFSRGKGKAPRRGRGGYPEGLKGKEIGLWYAGRSKFKATERDRKQRPVVDIDQRKVESLSTLLSSIRGSDRVNEDSSELNASVDQSQYLPSSKDSVTKRNPSRTSTETGVKRDWFLSSSTDTEIEQKRFSTPATRCEIEQEKYSTFQNEKDDQQERVLISHNTENPEHCDTSTAARLASCSFFSENRVSGREETLIKEEYDYEKDNDDGNDDDDDEDDDCCRKLAVKSEKLSDADFGVYEDDEDMLEDCTELPQVSEMFKYRQDESDFMFEYRLNKEGNRRSRERLSETEKLVQPQQDHLLDLELREKQKQKESNSTHYKHMLRFRQKLPSYQMRQEIVDLIKANQVVVISGETGCGKTTQVSQFILDDYILHGVGSMCRVVCTQPRRISAISVAERVADERAERCGEASVGYQIRLEHKLPRKRGSILYCTTGILMKWLIDDPWLSSTSHVILDEIHERDLQSDFLMIILKDLLLQRKDLKLILMSATLNAELFSQYFRNCPMTNIPGYTFPVKEYLLEDIVELTRYLHSKPPVVKKKYPGGFGRSRRDLQLEMHHFQNWCDSLHHRYSRETIQVLKCIDPVVVDLDLMVTLIEHICRNKQEGAILVFQPGWDQIKSLHDKLLAKTLFKSGKFRIIPLHSQMPTINQREVFERPPHGVRKIIIATNIAETSITIDDVVYVVDCGKVKMKNFDTENNIATLKPEWVSRANSRQRRGRAGRVRPGECYHLYTSYHEAKLEDYQLPEILRTRLEELCLQIKLLKLGMIEPFVSKAMQPPSLDALHLARQMLLDMNALDANEDLTPLGYHLSKMPVDPHTGKMLLFAAMFSCLDPICTVAASLSFKNAFYIPMGMEKIADQRRRRLSRKSRSDHIMLINAYQGWERASSWKESKHFCSEHFLSVNILQMLRNMRKQFADLLHGMGFIETANPKCSEANRNSGNHKLIKAVICAGLYPNVAKICKPRNNPESARPTTLMTKSDRRVMIHLKSVNEQESEFRSPWLVYHLKMKTSKIFIFDCTEVSPYPLLFFGGAISARMDRHVHCVAVDNWITFQATKRVASLVKELRSELDKLLEYKIRHPGVTNWDPAQKEGALIRAILDLITTEETRVPGMNAR